MKIYLIRHGLTELNKQKILNGQIDEPLAFEGLEQARVIAKLLPQTISHIYASSMLRTMQTAQVVNETLNVPLSPRDELRETHMGSIAGQGWTTMKAGTELKNKHRSMQFDYRPQGGESIENFKKRVMIFLQDINNKHGDYEVLVVAHGGIIRLLHLLEYGLKQHNELEHATLLTFDTKKILKNYQKETGI